MELRTINDWFVKFQLRTVAGVTDVLSNGGEVRQYQVQVDPNKLFKYDLALSHLRDAISNNNVNVGGWYIEGAQEQLVVRGSGLIRGGEEGLIDIENIVLKTVDGTPVYVRDVADVRFGSEIRQGAVTMDGKGEVVMGIVLQLKGANTKKVIEGVREKLIAIQAAMDLAIGGENKIIWTNSDCCVKWINNRHISAAVKKRDEIIELTSIISRLCKEHDIEVKFWNSRMFGKIPGHLTKGTIKSALVVNRFAVAPETV